MTQKAIAELLNDRQYTEEISAEIKEALANTDIVVVFGASDDLMEFRGAIYDEVDCYDGGKAYLDSDGLLENKCDEDDCPYFQEKKNSAVVIEALWCLEEPYSWTYKTDIPHTTFNIHKDDELYCRGIVFNLSDVKQIQKATGK